MATSLSVATSETYGWTFPSNDLRTSHIGCIVGLESLHTSTHLDDLACVM